MPATRHTKKYCEPKTPDYDHLIFKYTGIPLDELRTEVRYTK